MQIKASCEITIALFRFTMHASLPSCTLRALFWQLASKLVVLVLIGLVTDGKLCSGKLAFPNVFIAHSKRFRRLFRAKITSPLPSHHICYPRLSFPPPKKTKNVQTSGETYANACYAGYDVFVTSYFRLFRLLRRRALCEVLSKSLVLIDQP